MNREEIRATLSPIQALTCTLFGEARSASMHGVAAVASVIRNRADHPRWWGKDIKSVCLAPSQFSCWWEGEHANTRAVYDLGAALLTKQPLGDRSLVSEIQWVAMGIVENVIRDVARGCDHYLTSALWRSPKCPTWALSRTPVFEESGHAFFRLEL